MKIPFRAESAAPAVIDIYFLMEHLSELSRPFVFHALDYVIDAYRERKRAWIREHDDMHGLSFDSVVPVIFHTGLKPSRNLAPMVTGKQDSLLPQLRKKFGKRVTARVVKHVQSTDNISRLDAWSENILDAKTLQEVGLDA